MASTSFFNQRHAGAPWSPKEGLSVPFTLQTPPRRPVKSPSGRPPPPRPSNGLAAFDLAAAGVASRAPSRGLGVASRADPASQVLPVLTKKRKKRQQRKKRKTSRGVQGREAPERPGSSTAAAIELSSSSASEEEEEPGAASHVPESDLMAAAGKDVLCQAQSVSCQFAALDDRSWSFDDDVQLELRSWKATSVELVVGTEPQGPVLTFRQPDVLGCECWHLPRDRDRDAPLQAAQRPPPFAALRVRSNGAERVLVLAPCAASDAAALLDHLVARAPRCSDLTTPEQADAVLTAWASGAGPRLPRRPSLTRKRPRSDLVLANPDMLFRYPFAADARNPIVVSKADVARLSPPEYLNDNLIDLSLRLLLQQPGSVAGAGNMRPQRHRLTTAPRPGFAVHALTTQFFTKLTERHDSPPGGAVDARTVHARVANWTKDVDIFACDLVFVPVHESLHWSLAVLCHLRNFCEPIQRAVQGPRPCILVMDSLQAHDAERVAAYLRTFVRQEWAQRRGGHSGGGGGGGKVKKLPLVVPDHVPMQQNLFDCGAHVLLFARQLYHAMAFAPPGCASLSVERWKPPHATARDTRLLRNELAELCGELEQEFKCAVGGHMAGAAKWQLHNTA